MRTKCCSTLVAVFLYALFLLEAFSTSSDGIIGIGLTKRKSDQVNHVVGKINSKEGAVLRGPVRKYYLLNGLRDSQDIDIVSLKNYMDAQYFREIGIGTPSHKESRVGK